MVWHYFPSDDFCLIAKTGFVQQMLEPESNFVHENWASIFRRSDHMVLAAVHDVVVRLVSFECHRDNYAAQSNLTKAKSSAYIPMPEGRGFTPTSVRNSTRSLMRRMRTGKIAGRPGRLTALAFGRSLS